MGLGSSKNWQDGARGNQLGQARWSGGAGYDVTCPALTGPTFGIPNSVHCVNYDHRYESNAYRLRDLGQGLQTIGPQAVCRKGLYFLVAPYSATFSS